MAVFCGLDVGKAEHHAVALDPDGERLVDRPLRQRRDRRCGRCSPRWAAHGPVVVVVDQPASIGALPVAVAQAMGIDTRLPAGAGDAPYRRPAPGQGQDRRPGRFVIADAARTMPHTLRSVDIAGPAMADLAVLVGYDDDLRDQVTAATNRIRNLLLSIHPALERALGDDLAHPAVLALLARYGGPTGLRSSRAGTHRHRAGEEGPAHARPAGRARSGRRWASRPSWWPAPPRPRRSCPAWPTRWPTCWTSAAQIAAEVEKVLDDTPSCRGPDLDARRRRQDRSPHPGRGRRRQLLPHRRAPGRLRRPGPGHPPLRILHQRRTPRPGRQQTAQERAVPVRVRRPARPRITGLLRPQTRREARNTTPPSSAWPDAASTSSTPCCATAPTTSPNTPPRLDRPHRDTPLRNVTRGETRHLKSGVAVSPMPRG